MRCFGTNIASCSLRNQQLNLQSMTKLTILRTGSVRGLNPVKKCIYSLLQYYWLFFKELTILLAFRKWTEYYSYQGYCLRFYSTTKDFSFISQQRTLVSVPLNGSFRSPSIMVPMVKKRLHHFFQQPVHSFFQKAHTFLFFPCLACCSTLSSSLLLTEPFPTFSSLKVFDYCTSGPITFTSMSISHKNTFLGKSMDIGF